LLHTPNLRSRPLAALLLSLTVASGGDGRYRTSIVVNASPQRAWAVLTRYETMAGQLPDIQQVRLLSRSGSNLQLQQTYQAPYTFGRRIKATLRLQEEPPKRLSYQLIQGDDLRELQGSWTITPLGKTIRLTHQLRIDPVVPAFIRPVYDELFEANLLQSMRTLKRLMETP
jgi:ribosome-associated toxin RatA of RatAB toxin-antitoxin module